MTTRYPHRWTPEPNGLCRYCGQVERICPGICKPPASDSHASVSPEQTLGDLPYLFWNDMRVSCPCCAAPRGTGCFVPLLGGHQTVRVHPERRERAVATAALLASAQEAGLDA